ncbi:acetyl-synthetase [Moniliophthora roreri]|nr:acetyl-synthetase [Moniliophthora roreri]
MSYPHQLSNLSSQNINIRQLEHQLAPAQLDDVCHSSYMSECEYPFSSADLTENEARLTASSVESYPQVFRPSLAIARTTEVLIF